MALKFEYGRIKTTLENLQNVHVGDLTFLLRQFLSSPLLSTCFSLFAESKNRNKIIDSRGRWSGFEFGGSHFLSWCQNDIKMVGATGWGKMFKRSSFLLIYFCIYLRKLGFEIQCYFPLRKNFLPDPRR